MISSTWAKNVAVVALCTTVGACAITITVRVNDKLDRVDSASIQKAMVSLASATKSMDTLTARVDKALIPLLECRGNAACLPSQILATVGSVKAMAGAGAKAAPALVEQVKKSSEAMGKSADNVALLTANLSTAARHIDGEVAKIGEASTATLAEVKPTLDASAALVKDLDDRMGTLVDPARETLMSVRDTSAQLKLTSIRFTNDFLPKVEVNVDRFTLKAADVADNFARLTKPHWYDRIINYGMNGITAYLGFRPATVTVKRIVQQ